MRILLTASAMFAALAVGSPALAQAKMTEWTPTSLKQVLTDMGFKVVAEKPAGTDYMIQVSAPNNGLPIVIYGTHCAQKNGAPACPGADLTTSFKVKDEASKNAGFNKLSMPGYRVIPSASAMALRIELPVDFSAGLTSDQVKAKVSDYEKSAETAFSTLKDGGLLDN